MVVLLNIQVNCSCLRAKTGHISGHSPVPVVNWANLRTQILASDPLVRRFAQKMFGWKFELISEMDSLVRQMKAVFWALFLFSLLAFLVLLLAPVSPVPLL